MKYLKLFDEHADYTTYSESSTFTEPNVSYCLDTNDVHFNEYVDVVNGHEYVDLGLQSGNLWATSNVGAVSETDSGKYFAWGETVGYDASEVGSGDGQHSFNVLSYKWTDAKNEIIAKYNAQDGKTSLDLSDDAVNAAMGGNWRTPTPDEFEELFQNTTVEEETIDGVTGLKFTGINSNYIFIPYGGAAINTEVNTGNNIALWTNALLGVGETEAKFAFNGNNLYIGQLDTYNGLQVRGIISVGEPGRLTPRPIHTITP